MTSTRHKIFYCVTLLVLLASFLAVSCAPAAGPAQPNQPATSGGDKAAKTTNQDKWETILANARKEGTVVVYTSVAGPAIREAIQPVVQKKFGFTMELVVGKSDEVTQKIMTERQRGLFLADAHIAGTQMLVSYKNPNVLAPLDEALFLPEATDPQAWADGKLPFLDKDKYTLALTGAYWTYILVNTDMVKEGEIKSYKDLVLPQWKGKMIMFDPTIGGAGVNWMMFVRKVMGVEEGEKYLRQLANTQDLMLTRDARLQGEWVAKGKYPVAIAPSTAVITPLFKAGAPVAWAKISDGGLMHPSGSVFGLADKPPHPNAAKVLFNWLLTAEGQRLFSDAYGQPPLRKGIPAESVLLIPGPGDKVFLADETFILETESKGKEIAQDIFGQLLK